MPVTLEEAKRLAGIEDWALTPAQEAYLIKSAEDLLSRQRYTPEELLKMRGLFRAQLEFVFKEIY